MFASNTSQVSSDAVFIEDVMSCFLYTGNGSTQTITNGIDLAGKGGLVWLKSRNTSAISHGLFDSARGFTNINGNYLNTASTSGGSFEGSFAGVSTTGFSLAAGNYNSSNTSFNQYTSWTFRKQPKFFDVVTYTGTGSAQTIAHNLGSTPGCIIVKCVDGASYWSVYHQNLTNANYWLKLNLTDAQASDSTIWNGTAPTSTVFSVGSSARTNQSGFTYVAYLFAHNAGGFGLTGTDNVISCGSFTTDGSGNATINLGYEPQWVLMKTANVAAYDWVLLDTMRGWNMGTSDATLNPNSSAAESGQNWGDPTATGFTTRGWWANQTIIYIAIRRGPMKVPTSGTSVFAPVAQASGGFVTTNFPVDSIISTGRTNPSAVGGIAWLDRLRGSSIYSVTSSVSAETNAGTVLYGWNYSNIGAQDYAYAGTGASGIYWNFRRAPGFFDEVCYTGTGVAGNVLAHNLGVAPELVIFKTRSSTGSWWTYCSYLTNPLNTQVTLNTTNAANTSSGNQFLSAVSASSITTGTEPLFGINSSGVTYVAYLFASCPGVSKVGSYTGTGATQTIDCGFTGGARFVLIKRTDSTGDWYVWDTARGMVSGTDPSLLLNSTAAEVNANSVYTTSVGFQIVSTAAGINASGGSYIYLAIA